MYVITLIHKNGGSRTVTGHSVLACKQSAYKISKVFHGSYIAATVPYEVTKGEKGFDVTVPFEIKKALGIELRLTLSDQDS